MSDILREIDEELRAERLARLWQRHGRLFISVAVLVTVAAIGFSVWRTRQADARAAQGLAFQSALFDIDRANIGGAQAILADLVVHGTSGYRGLALLTQADLKIGQGDNGAAIGAFDDVASDSHLAPELRDIATLRGAMLRLDRGDPAQTVKDRLQPLLQDANALRSHALEIVALAQLQANDRAGARDSLKQLADDPTTPAGIRSQAAELLSSLGS